ncbi:hypothetical protein [Rhodococcus jostii]|nr:hypothetical protein [Rhodococcus jostii]
MDVTVVVSVVAAGTVVAGLSNEPPVEIPGCDVVVPPTEPRRFSVGYSPSQDYDNAKYPWFSGAKATAMTDAILESLPGDVDVVFASPVESFEFQPIDDIAQSQLPDFVDAELFNGSTSARGSLIRDGHVGTLTVDVRSWDRPIPPCIAGAQDRRDELPNGTVLDSQDTVADIGGVRSVRRTVVAYLPDGTRVVARSDDSARIPLTLEELSAVTTTPDLAVTAEVPPGTLPPMPPCSADSNGTGPVLTRESVAELNRALDERWAAAPRTGSSLDRPLGSLRPGDFGKDNVCEALTATSGGSSGRLEISIRSGRDARSPHEQLLSELDRDRKAETLPDGSVIVRASYPSNGSEFVSITRPSGAQVVVSASAPGASASPLSLAELEFIATTPGLAS